MTASRYADELSALLGRSRDASQLLAWTLGWLFLLSPLLLVPIFKLIDPSF